MTRSTPLVAIDCRMLGMSGIGVYLHNLLPEVVARLPHCAFRLIGHPARMQALALPARADIDLHDCRAPIYSLREQALLPVAARGANLLWVPHYNIPLLSGVPLMVTVHDVAHLVLPEVARNPLRRAYATILFAAVRHKARTVLTVSRFTADEFTRVVGPPRGRLRVVANGVDPSWSAPAPPPGSEGCRVPPPYFIAVGNIKAHKRIDLLCRAFAAVKNDVPHTLVLAGKHEGFLTGGQSVEQLLELAPGRIMRTGPIDGPNLRHLVREADALVFPSAYEGFGLPPLEAMAAGTPVIAADIAPVREVCAEHAVYFAVDDVQALSQRLREFGKFAGPERGNRTRLAARLCAARAHAAAFTWQAGADAVAEEIRRLCGA